MGTDYDPELAESEKRGLVTGKPKPKSRIARGCGAAVFAAALIWLFVVLSPISRGRDADKLHWVHCKEDDTMLCTVFEVPTDYDDPSAGVTKLAMTKIPATKHPRQGSLLTNYGGPGGPGYMQSFYVGKFLIHPFAPTYDLISWDPRGIGRTTPNVDCYGSPLAPLLAKANTPLEESLDVPTDPLSEAGTADMVAQQTEAIALIRTQMQKCTERMGGDVLKYMGTTTLIKDMERIQAVLDGPDADINLISGSYGTIVAAYLVNMLPDKIGKVMTSGVVVADEATLEWFVTDCHAAGNECALHEQDNKSPQDVLKRIDRLLDDLYKSPLSVPDANRPGVLKSGMVRGFLFGALQSPAGWPTAARGLADAMQGNGTIIRNRIARPFDPTPEHDGYVNSNQGDLARLAVSCADMPPYRQGEAWPSAEERVERLQRILKDVSPHFGATVHLMEQHGECQFWPRPKKPTERFTGPWNKTLKNPIIVASNTHDPITPRSQGRRMAELLEHSARHFVQNAPGHTYGAPPVSTYLKAVNAYFENGTLPDEFETFFPSEGRNFFKDSEKHPYGSEAYDYLATAAFKL